MHKPFNVTLLFGDKIIQALFIKKKKLDNILKTLNSNMYNFTTN